MIKRTYTASAVSFALIVTYLITSDSRAQPVGSGSTRGQSISGPTLVTGSFPHQWTNKAGKSVMLELVGVINSPATGKAGQFRMANGKIAVIPAANLADADAAELNASSLTEFSSAASAPSSVSSLPNGKGVRVLYLCTLLTQGDCNNVQDLRDAGCNVTVYSLAKVTGLPEKVFGISEVNANPVRVPGRITFSLRSHTPVNENMGLKSLSSEDWEKLDPGPYHVVWFGTQYIGDFIRLSHVSLDAVIKTANKNSSLIVCQSANDNADKRQYTNTGPWAQEEYEKRKSRYESSITFHFIKTEENFIFYNDFLGPDSPKGAETVVDLEFSKRLVAEILKPANAGKFARP